MTELSEVAAFLAATDPVCVVRVAQRRGLGPVAAGQIEVRSADASAGRLLGGATHVAVGELADQVLADGHSRTTTVDLGQPEAVAAGLACAGSVTLVAHRLDTESAVTLGCALGAGEVAALAGRGNDVVVLSGRDLHHRSGFIGADEAVDARAAAILRRGVSATETFYVDGVPVLLDVWFPVPTVLVVGGGALAAAIGSQAELLGWSVQTVAAVDEAHAHVATLRASDVLVLLDHSPDFDGVLLDCARGPAFAGALGSRHTQAARRERLLGAGATEAELAAVHGPVGLDLGARAPAAVAVSIVAQVLAHHAGREPVELTSAGGRIGW